MLHRKCKGKVVLPKMNSTCTQLKTDNTFNFQWVYMYTHVHLFSVKLILMEFLVVLKETTGAMTGFKLKTDQKSTTQYLFQISRM